MDNIKYYNTKQKINIIKNVYMSMRVSTLIFSEGSVSQLQSSMQCETDE